MEDEAQTAAAGLRRHQQALAACRRCPAMVGTPVIGRPVPARILLVGQAPGRHELEIKRPFAWTAGKTLFGWFARLGLDEEAVRSQVYFAAVCRCFPGRTPAGGDRVPERDEIAACSDWLAAEIGLLRPALIVPVGRLAIARFLVHRRLDEVVGGLHRIEREGHATDILPLPHPSGASTWHRTEPGRGLLEQALARLQAHPAWRALKPGACRT